MQPSRGKFLACVLTACLLSAIAQGREAAVAQDRDWNCPPTPALPDNKTTWEKWFAGSIGGVDARMHLIGAGDVAKGEFYHTDDWKPVIIGGNASADGTLQLHDEQDSKCGATDECAGPGLLRARLDKTGLTGTWTPSSADHPQSIEMHIQSAPRCDAEGPKRTFRNPSWPITFEYPAAWRLFEAPNTISLLCPDPARMAYEGSNISLTIGNLDPGGHLPNDARLSEFTRDNKGAWQYESSLGGGPNPAILQQRRGLTIVRAQDASRRGYCTVGGYTGLTDEELTLILSGDHWILINGGPHTTDIVDLIVNTVELRE